MFQTGPLDIGIFSYLGKSVAFRDAGAFLISSVVLVHVLS